MIRRSIALTTIPIAYLGILISCGGEPNSFTGELDAALWDALNKMTSFPMQDLFGSFR